MNTIADKRVVIFTNGVIRNPRFYLSLLEKNDFILCANGGTVAVLELDLLPDLVIGDLDSLDQKERSLLAERGVPVSRYPAEKDYSDLELALMHALDNGAAEIMILGAGGGRPDQFFANLMLLNLPLQRKIPAVMVNEEAEIRLVDRELTLNGEVGEVVSLLPVSAEATVIKTEGLQFPLRGETLSFSSTRGLSNVLKESQAKISLGKGLLLAVHLRNKSRT